VLYLRETPLGPVTEQWVHAYGCRQWIHVVRDTRTHAILDTRPLSAPPVEPTG
jgi:sarcosine oxidase subunit delta